MIYQTERRLPPASEEAERGVLGSAMIEPEQVIEKCSELGVTEDTFYTPAHRLLYRHLCMMYTEAKEIDLLTVGVGLKNEGVLDQVGGHSFLEGLIDSTPTAAHAEYYIEIIQQKQLARKIITCSVSAIEGCYEDKEPEVVLSTLQSEALSLATDQSDEISMEDHGEEFIEHCIHGTQGHFPHFCDNWTARLGRLSNEIVFLHAPRSTGKTALAIQWQRNLHKLGLNVPMLSLESLKQTIVPRYIAQEAQVNTFAMKRGMTPPYSTKYQDARDALQRLREMNLTVRDGNMTIEQIMAFAKLHKNAGASGIIIDNLLCIGSNKDFESRTKMYIYFLEHIRKIRNAVNIPIIILAHPNEDGKIAWARDVENFADVIMYLYNVDEMRERDERAFNKSGLKERFFGDGHTHVCCKIQKYRDGDCPRLELDFDKEHQTFYPLD